MTKKQMKENHYKVWKWIADHCHEYPEVHDNHKLKSLAFQALGLGMIINNCFACEACDLICEKCPCDWGDDMDHCEINGTPYMDFISSDNIKDKRKYALKVKKAWK